LAIETIFADVLAVLLPADLAGVLVERHDILHIRAVAVENQQILPENGRTAGAVPVLVFELLGLPDNPAVGRQAGRAVLAEMNVDAIAFQDRRRRGMTVFLVDRAGIFLF